MQLSLDSSAQLTGFPAWHHIPPAGKTPRESAGEAKDAFQVNPPPTPPNERRFRQTAIVPGTTVRHFGRALDPVHTDLTHGIKTSSKAGDTVKDALQTLPASDILCWNQDRKERIYARSVALNGHHSASVGLLDQAASKLAAMATSRGCHWSA